MKAKKELTHPLTRATLVFILDTREVAMIRSGTINTIHELSAQGKSIREIARIVGIARNTVRRYLREQRTPRYGPRQPRACKLDPYKGFLQKRVEQARADWIPATVLRAFWLQSFLNV